MTLLALLAALVALFYLPALVGPVGVGLGAIGWFRGDRLGCLAAGAAFLAMIIGALVTGQILQGLL